MEAVVPEVKIISDVDSAPMKALTASLADS